MPLQSRRIRQAGPPGAPERCSWGEWGHNEHDLNIPERGVVLLYEGILHSEPDKKTKKKKTENDLLSCLYLSKNFKSLSKILPSRLAWNILLNI